MNMVRSGETLVDRRRVDLVGAMQDWELFTGMEHELGLTKDRLGALGKLLGGLPRELLAQVGVDSVHPDQSVFYLDNSGEKQYVEPGELLRINRYGPSSGELVAMGVVADGMRDKNSPFFVPQHLKEAQAGAKLFRMAVETAMREKGLDPLAQAERAEAVEKYQMENMLLKGVGVVKAIKGGKERGEIRVRTKKKNVGVAEGILQQWGLKDAESVRKYLSSGDSDAMRVSLVRELAKKAKMKVRGVGVNAEEERSMAREIVAELVVLAEVVQAVDGEGKVWVERVRQSLPTRINGVWVASADAGVARHHREVMVARAALGILTQLERGNDALGWPARARAGIVTGADRLAGRVDRVLDDLSLPPAEDWSVVTIEEEKGNTSLGKILRLGGVTAGVTGLVWAATQLGATEVQSGLVVQVEDQIGEMGSSTYLDSIWEKSETGQPVEKVVIRGGESKGGEVGWLENQIRGLIPEYEEKVAALDQWVKWEVLAAGGEQAQREIERVAVEMGRDPTGVLEMGGGITMLLLGKKRRLQAMMVLLYLTACSPGLETPVVVLTPTYAVPGVEVGEAGGVFPADIDWIEVVDPFDSDHVKGHADQVAVVAQNSVREVWGDDVAESMQFWAVTGRMPNGQELEGGMMGVFQDKNGNVWVSLVENTDGSFSYLGRSAGSVREYLLVPSSEVDRWQIVSRTRVHRLFEMGSDMVVRGFLPLNEEADSDWVHSPDGFGGGRALLMPAELPGNLLDLIRAGGRYDAERRVWQDTRGYDVYMLTGDGSWVFVGGEPTVGAIVDESGHILDANGNPIEIGTATPEAGVLDVGRVLREEMEGKVPTVRDASMGDYEIVQSESGAYRAINERFGVDVELTGVKDQYGERLVGDDGRTVFLKNHEDKWIVAPTFIWKDKRAELGLYSPEGNGPSINEDGTKAMQVVGELVGYGEPVRETYQGKSYDYPTALLWVGNKPSGEKIIVRMIMGSAMDDVGVIPITGVGGLAEEQRFSGGGIVHADYAQNAVLYVGGTYAIAVTYDQRKLDNYSAITSVEILRKYTDNPEWVEGIEETVIAPKYYDLNNQLVRLLSGQTSEWEEDSVALVCSFLVPFFEGELPTWTR
ncbi:MAG: hypothetical protein V1487_00770 [bacterium]